jgi:hypothetical protein
LAEGAAGAGGGDRGREAVGPAPRSLPIGTCLAYAPDSPVVRRHQATGNG